MNTNNYVAPEILLSKAAIMVGDREFKNLPVGFYHALIQQAFEKLALHTFFDEKRANIPLDGGLVYSLPVDCFNVKDVYIFTGTICEIAASRKVWWKRNYFTEGVGYIANDTGRNFRDPFYNRHDNWNSKNAIEHLPGRQNGIGVNNELFYNFQMGNIMLSSSCLAAGQNLHIHYNGTGCPIGEAPIIPIYLREVMEDYVITEALLARMANDTGDIRKWQSLYQTHSVKLNTPYTGSWDRAELIVKSMNSSQRESLKEYLGRSAWMSGL